MVIFDELRITKDLNRLVLSVHIAKEFENKNIFLDKVYVYSCSKVEDYNENMVAKKDDLETATYIFSGNVKQGSVILDSLYPNFPKLEGLVFVCVTIKHDEDEDIPCEYENPTVGVTMNLSNFYNTFLSYMKEMDGGSCIIQQGLIDLILRYKALNVSIDSNHYQQAVIYYDKWFNKLKRNTSKLGCGCYGK